MFTNGKVLKADATIREYLDYKDPQGRQVVTRSELCEIVLCPAKWKFGPHDEDKATPSTDFGSLVDCLLLQPDKFTDYYVTTPATYTNSKKQVADWTWQSPTCREWRDTRMAQGLLVATPEEVETAQKAVSRLHSHPDLGDRIKKLLGASQKQVFSVAEYHDKDTGIVLVVKALTDVVPPDWMPEYATGLLDLKTSKSAEPRKWTKSVWDFNYHVQAAMNLQVFNAATGQKRKNFYHLIIENTEPFEPATRQLSKEYVEIGLKRVQDGLRILCQCLKANKWPSYTEPGMLFPNGFYCCEPLPWMLKQDGYEG